MGMFTLWIFFPGNVDTCQQVQVVLAFPDLFQDPWVTFPVFMFAPDLDHQQICIRDQDFPCLLNVLILQSGLPPGDPGKIITGIWPLDLFKVFTGEFGDPLGVIMFSQCLGQGAFPG